MELLGQKRRRSCKGNKWGLHFSFNGQINQENDMIERTNNKREGLVWSRLTNQHLLDIKLAALEKKGYAELISTPVLLTGNQQRS